MSDVYQDSLELHRKHKGKIEVVSKVPLENKKDLSLAYSPGVAEISRVIGKDPSAVYEYTNKGNMVAIVSDGSAILGLGNLGAAAAIPVMEGKAALFKKFAGIDAFPICLDTQDEDKIVETVKLLAPVFGGINLEDISAPRCFSIEARLRKELSIPVMHDDQHGTAVVVLAGLLNSLKLRGNAKEEVKVVINGAGAAGTAITELLVHSGFKNILVCDSKGLISSSRTDLNPEKQKIVSLTGSQGALGTLEDGLQGADIFIGVSKAGLLTKEMVQTMNERPVIFALANPDPEIMPEVAKEAGAFIVATGRSDYPNQVNNALAFPGIFKGALQNRIAQFEERMFVRAAEIIAEAVTDLSPENIIPDLFTPNLAERVAEAIK